MIFRRHAFGRLAAYAEGQLDAVEAARVERHLRTCSRCRAALDEVRRGIVLASELEAEPMPEPVAAAMRARLAHAPGGRPATRFPRRAWAAAALLLAVAGAALYWQMNRPWARLAAAAEPSAFERQGRELHDRLAAGEPLELVSADEREVWRWLQERAAPTADGAVARAARGEDGIVPVGAAIRSVAGARASVVSYRVNAAPVTLVLARAAEVPDAPASGWLSKRVLHRRDRRGLNTLTWTSGGGTYVLVSELDGYGQQACFICHGEQRFREEIRGMELRD